MLLLAQISKCYTVKIVISGVFLPYGCRKCFQTKFRSRNQPNCENNHLMMSISFGPGYVSGHRTVNLMKMVPDNDPISTKSQTAVEIPMIFRRDLN